MIKRKTQLKTLAAAAVLAFAAPIMAAEEGDPTGAYVGVGAAFVELDCPTNLPGGFRCSSANDTVPMVYIGGMANKHFGAELGYAHEAEFKLSDGRGGTGTIKYSSLYFALIGRVPFNDNVAVFGKLGANSASASASVSTGTSFGSAVSFDTGLMYGGGLEVSSGNFAGRLEYSVVDEDVAYGGLSILYRFR